MLSAYKELTARGKTNPMWSAEVNWGWTERLEGSYPAVACPSEETQGRLPGKTSVQP